MEGVGTFQTMSGPSLIFNELSLGGKSKSTYGAKTARGASRSAALESQFVGCVSRMCVVSVMLCGGGCVVERCRPGMYDTAPSVRLLSQTSNSLLTCAGTEKGTVCVSVCGQWDLIIGLSKLTRKNFSADKISKTGNQ